jgi:hypothetical protein
LVCKKSISSDFRDVQDIQKSCSRRLFFIRNVAMPCYRTGPCLEECFCGCISRASVYEVNLCDLGVSIFLVQETECLGSNATKH